MSKLKNLKKYKNSGESEAKIFAEEFHGRAVRDVIQLDEIEKTPTNLAVIGDLYELEIVPLHDEKLVFELNLEKEIWNKKTLVKVCCDAKGEQIYFVGGNQNLQQVISKLYQVEKLTSRFWLVGWVEAITYWTDKYHLDYEDKPWWSVILENLDGSREEFKTHLRQANAESIKESLENDSKFSGVKVQIGCQYRHEFGEEKNSDSCWPMLIFDKLNEKMILSGGSYVVRDVGIWN